MLREFIENQHNGSTPAKFSVDIEETVPNPVESDKKDSEPEESTQNDQTGNAQGNSLEGIFLPVLGLVGELLNLSNL